MTHEQIQALKADAETSADNFKPKMVVDTKLIRSLLAEHDADKALIAEQDARLIEYARIATENAARTLTVNLPSQTDFDDPLSAYEAIEKCREEIKSACAAAGITLVVEE